MKKLVLVLISMLLAMGIALHATSLLVEDFTGLTVGNNLAGQSSWTKGGTGPDPTIGNATPLTYTNYNGGGGEYVVMPTATSTASRVYKGFTATTAIGNTFYYSFLLRLSSVGATSNYFITLGDSGTGSTYAARVFAKSSGTGFNLGASKSSSTATYNSTPTTLVFDQTYLVVVRYTAITGNTNDLVYLWINPTLSSEPLIGSAEVTVPSGENDPGFTSGNVGNFHWHNRAVSNPVGAFDGVRVAFATTSATAWTDLNAYSASGLTPPTLTADSSNNNVDNNIDITFTDNASWRAAITAVKIGGTALTVTTDYVLSAGNLQLKPSGGNTLLRTAEAKAVTIEATGYTNASVTQTINAGAVTANSTATISSALAINASRTVTCTAKDQYNNLVSEYTFKYDATITNDNATTNESYTIDGTGRNASVNDISLVTLTNVSGVATFTIAIPAVVDGGDGVSVQVLLADGSTNVSSAFTYTKQQSAPTVTTPTAASIKATTATLGGNVTFDGESPILERGTVWKTSAEVTINDNKLAEGTTTTGVFTHQRTGLPPETQIFYRAYARNAIGTTLSTEASFTTLKAEPSDHVASFAVSTSTLSTITLTWADAAKVTPNGYLIKGSSVGFSSIDAPVDGTAETNAPLVRNVTQGTQTYQFSGLSVSTPYYFKIYPYTNSGTGIDYKTDGAVPQVSGSTTALPLSYIVDFEGATETKGAYASGTVNLSGIDWNLTDVMTSTTTDADWYEGGRSARLRGYGTSAMTMLADKTTGVGTFSFKYRRYGTDAQLDWKVEYSTNSGTEWTQLGDAFTAPDSDVVQTFTAPVNIAGNIRFRVKRATESGTSNRRLNIDDITLSEYFDYPTNTPVVTGSYTITLTQGNGNINSAGVNSTPPNPAFTPTFIRHITLVGNGPWTITLATTDDWVTYRRGVEWTSIENLGTSVQFTVPAIRDAEIEIQSGSGGNPTLPVELSSFTATMNAHNNAILTWVTQTETGVSGFYVYRNLEANLETAELLSNLIPATNTSSQQVYVYTDNELQGVGTYYYWLQVSDMDGTDTFHGPITLTYDGGNNNTNPVIPTVTKLSNVFPNPFNPSTQISYSLAKDAKVRFEIFNSRGQLVRNIEAGNKAVGNYTLVWNGVDNNSNSVPTGVYYIRMHAGAQSFSRKAVLMK